MVQTYQSPVRVYKWPFELIMAVHPDNPEWTCFEQSATLDVKSFFGFEATVEKIAVKQYAANIQKGKEILEGHVKALLESGQTYFPPFEDNAKTSPSPADSAIEISRPEDEGSDGNATRDEEETGRLTGRTRTGTLTKATLTLQHSIDEKDKLESEYIHRFLGELTTLEESRLCELKYCLKNSHKGKVPNDAHLLRFLRARDFELVKAREMVTASMLWRKQHNVDRILSSYQPPPVLLQFFPGCWHKHDSQGRPVFVLRLGQLDIKGLLRSVGEDGLVKFVLSICEEGLKKTAEATKEKGTPISTWTLLVDMEGLSMRHLWRPGVKTLLKIIEIAEANYPETMGLALIVRAPRVSPVLWTLIGPLIHENTRAKFMIHGGQDCAVELREYIPKEFLPDFLGGECFSLCPEGGHVPKHLYSQQHDSAPEGAEGDKNVLDSLYHTGYLYKGLPHEVLVKVATKGGILTWDFDVVKGSCDFCVLRTKSLIEPESLPHPSPPLGPLSPGALVAGMGSPHDVAFDRSLVLGTDLFMAEKPLKCQEGDSVQGSHCCKEAGTYVLQWRQSGSAPVPGSFDFTLPVKSKVVYYYELIDSVDFRGSMASLESCKSSFSSLSIANSNGKRSSGHDTPGSSKKNTSS